MTLRNKILVWALGLIVLAGLALYVSGLQVELSYTVWMGPVNVGQLDVGGTQDPRAN